MPKLLSIKNFRGIVTIGDIKDISPEHAYEQSDMCNTLLDSVSTRPGFTKSNTSVYAGKMLGIFQYRKKSGQYKTLSANSNGELRGD